MNTELPTIIFGAMAVLSAMFTLFLPETLHKEMPQTIEDGERFGVGDTAYKTCFNFLRTKQKNSKGDLVATPDSNDELSPN